MREIVMSHGKKSLTDVFDKVIFGWYNIRKLFPETSCSKIMKIISNWTKELGLRVCFVTTSKFDRKTTKIKRERKTQFIFKFNLSGRVLLNPFHIYLPLTVCSTCFQIHTFFSNIFFLYSLCVCTLIQHAK